MILYLYRWNVVHSTEKSKFDFNVNFLNFPSVQAVTDAMLVELKSCFMEAYDDNQDGKIDIREVSIQIFYFLFMQCYL